MLVVGLGNPGKEYENTHHNVGFMFVDKIAESLNATFRVEKKFNASTIEFIMNGKKHYLMKPLTYMNLSGMAVRAFIDYYKIPIEEVFVIYDDMDLGLGVRRIRKNGSAGGHNGMKSMIKETGTDQIMRLRIGIGRKEAKDAAKKEQVIDFVLSKFSVSEKKVLDETLNMAPNIYSDLIEHGIDFIMNKYN